MVFHDPALLVGLLRLGPSFPVPDLVNEVLGYVFGDGVFLIRAAQGRDNTLVSHQ
jgi:hypothetical protein